MIARLLFAGALLVLAAPAAAFHVSYEYYCYATFSDGIPVGGDQILTGQVYTTGSYSKTGDHGNYGSASFTVDIANTMVSVAAHAHGVEYDTNRFATGTGRVEVAALQDRIEFTVPPGTYPDGAFAVMCGRTVGNLGSSIGAGAQAQFYASLGPESYDTGVLSSGIEEATSVNVNETWVLTLELVAPGATLNNPSIQAHLVNLGVYNGITWSVALNPEPGVWLTGDGDIDFPDGLRVTSFVATPGVTWISDSGIFASGLAAVPVAADGAVLHQNAPNPFNPATTIAWELEEPATVDLRIYDAAGRLVRTLLAGVRRAEGPDEVRWDGRDDAGRGAAAGVYLYRLHAGEAELTRRMTLVR